jgi:tetratricopeptide (TPR) repeat protein
VSKKLFKNLVMVGIAAAFFVTAPSITAQGRNTISGNVYGAEGKPIYEANIELLDEFTRLIRRTRTDSSGRYFFGTVPAGRLTVRVFVISGEYDDQSKEVEIVNLTRDSARGRTTSGFANEQVDFQLRLSKREHLTSPETVFAQEVPTPASDLYDQAIVDLKNNREEEGLKRLRSALEIFPKYYVALERLGVEYVRLKHIDEARILFTVAVNVNPRAYRSWFGLSFTLFLQNAYGEALSAIEEALKINATSPEAVLLYGRLLRRSHRYLEAEKQLKKSQELFGEAMPDVNWELALLYAYGLKRYKDAARELRLYLKALPDAKDAANIRKLIDKFESK